MLSTTLCSSASVPTVARCCKSVPRNSRPNLAASRSTSVCNASRERASACSSRLTRSSNDVDSPTGTGINIGNMWISFRRSRGLTEEIFGFQDEIQGQDQADQQHQGDQVAHGEEAGS